MKLFGAIFLASTLLATGSACAQTCAAPIPLHALQNVTGDTCTAQNELGTLCIFALSPANDIIYSTFFDPPYLATQISLTNNTPAWNAALVLVQGACNGNSVCPRNADAGGPGANETLDVSALAGGTYFLVVTSAVADTTCGSYGLTMNGAIPVELQSFDID